MIGRVILGRNRSNPETNNLIQWISLWTDLGMTCIDQRRIAARPVLAVGTLRMLTEVDFESSG